VFAFAFVFAFVFAFAWVSSNSHTSVELSTWQARLLFWLGGVTFILEAIHRLGDRPRPVCKQLFVFTFVFAFVCVFEFRELRSSHARVGFGLADDKKFFWLDDAPIFWKRSEEVEPRPVCKQVFMFMFVFAFDLSSRCVSGLMELLHVVGARKTLIKI